MNHDGGPAGLADGHLMLQLTRWDCFSADETRPSARASHNRADPSQGEQTRRERRAHAHPERPHGLRVVRHTQ